MKWLLFSLLALPALGQSQIKIRFIPTWGGLPISFPKTFVQESGDSLTLETFRIYLSQITLLGDGKPNATPTKQHFLLDAENPNSMEIQVAVKKDFKMDGIAFLMGIDSVTQSSGAMKADLDPVHGMYWTWQSGYIHFKMEGKNPQCQTRKNRFQWHIGGYAHPWSTIQKIRLVTKPQQNLMVEIRLDDFFALAQPSGPCEIMSPGQNAVNLSRFMASSFHLMP